MISGSSLDDMISVNDRGYGPSDCLTHLRCVSANHFGQPLHPSISAPILLVHLSICLPKSHQDAESRQRLLQMPLFISLRLS